MLDVSYPYWSVGHLGELEGLNTGLNWTEVRTGLSCFRFSHQDRRHRWSQRRRHEFPLCLTHTHTHTASEHKHTQMYGIVYMTNGCVYLGRGSGAWGRWRGELPRAHLGSARSPRSFCSWLCWSSGPPSRPRCATAPSSADLSPADVDKNKILFLFWFQNDFFT